MGEIMGSSMIVTSSVKLFNRKGEAGVYNRYPTFSFHINQPNCAQRTGKE